MGKDRYESIKNNGKENILIYYFKIFPVIFAVMTNKTTKLYRKIFQYIKNKLKINAVKIVADYEFSLRKAAKQVWCKAKIIGCWFHYVQAIRRKIWGKKSLANVVRKNKFASNIMQMFFKLPLLPLKHIEKGYEYILAYEEFHGIQNNYLLFNKYYHKTWVNKFSFSAISVSDEIHRTNNFVESYNCKIKKVIKKNPSIYSFLGNSFVLCIRTKNNLFLSLFIEGLQVLCQDAYSQHLSNEFNMNYKVSKSKIQRKLCAALSKLKNSEIDELQFLKMLIY